MPAVQTSYSAMMQPALEGACATILNDDNSATRICETVAGIPFGRVVSEGTDARGAVLGGASGLIGLSILDRTLVSPIGGNVYRLGDAIGILFAGDMWVRAMAAVTHGAIATYDAITGQLNPVSGGIELYGSRYITSAGAGQVALLRLISSASGEEEGTSEWVPADAMIHIDLVNDRAWTQVNGEVAVDRLLGSDPNTENGWAATLYDPESIIELGYSNGGPAVAFIGAARDLILVGATFVTTTAYFGSGGFTINPFAMVSANGNAGVFLQLNSVSQLFAGGSYVVAELITLSAGINAGEGDTVLNRTAVTISPARMELAVNGSEAIAVALSSDDYPASGDDQIVAALFDTTENTIAYQSVTIYAPLSDTTGLSELSAL